MSESVDVTVSVLFDERTQNLESQAISNLEKAVSADDFKVFLGNGFEELSPRVTSQVTVTTVALSPSEGSNSGSSDDDDPDVIVVLGVGTAVDAGPRLEF